MVLLEWINSNGLIFVMLCFIATVFLIGVDAVARELQDRHLWKIRRQRPEVQEVDPKIDEMIEYFEHIKDDFDVLSSEMELSLKELNRRATETKPVVFGENIVKLRDE